MIRGYGKIQLIMGDFKTTLSVNVGKCSQKVVYDVQKIWAVCDLGDMSWTLPVKLYPFSVWHKVMKWC